MTRTTAAVRPASLAAHGGKLAFTLAVALGLAACGGSSDDTVVVVNPPANPGNPGNPGTPTAPTAPTVVASGLRAPWSIAFYKGTPLVSERDTDRIVAVGSNGAVSEVAVIAGVNGSGEGGLLGIAVRDDYLYVYFTAGSQNRIVRYPLSGDGAGIRLGAVQSVLNGIPAASTHNGGRIAFGPDGMLYATAGDAANTARAQDMASLGGKILRMTPEGAVPRDNPFPGSYVYSLGHRNPQGIAWAADGAMYASEFGQNTWDELNRITAGANYGWPVVEGIATDSRYTNPLQQWSTSTASPSGMAIRGSSIYIANLRGERLRQIPLAKPSTSVDRYPGEYGRLRDVVVSPEGLLWMMTNNTDSRGEPRPGDDRIVSIPLQ
ncbi:PQQ-dependent sugar dehydrogenase [Duganella phyllosphaerae]|uniref:Quinoprotein glucose dehydrogenase B n=1 Tax=Duganella phyllosphaerae TaxID=762836 RepID=A0A1E7WH01_9BURK|nr:PQQ-dependent sugar dehydrogenase [Duganella phyllosphaerae]OEZ97811.1 quinoprotein glucose dehydrogenase B precursor [Duganella phyllosphaerae]